MDVSKIESTVSDVLSNRLNARKRYRGLAFISNSMPVLHVIRQKISQILAPIDIWDVPGEGEAPEAPITREEFCRAAFNIDNSNGLLINMPEEWMLTWTDADKRVFWSNLAQTYGKNDVYVICASTPSNLKNIQHHFQRDTVRGADFTILSSKYEQ